MALAAIFLMSFSSSSDDVSAKSVNFVLDKGSVFGAGSFFDAARSLLMFSASMSSFSRNICLCPCVIIEVDGQGGFCLGTVMLFGRRLMPRLPEEVPWLLSEQEE